MWHVQVVMETLGLHVDAENTHLLGLLALFDDCHALCVQVCLILHYIIMGVTGLKLWPRRLL